MALKRKEKKGRRGSLNPLSLSLLSALKRNTQLSHRAACNGLGSVAMHVVISNQDGGLFNLVGGQWRHLALSWYSSLAQQVRLQTGSLHCGGGGAALSKISEEIFSL